MINVIFDMDGTLLDTQKICIPAWTYAGELQGFENVGEHIPFVCGMNKAGWSAYLAKNFPTLDVDKFNDDSRRYVKENIVLAFKKGAPELIEYLKQNNIKMAVASGSSTETVKSNLKKLNVLESFDVVLGGDMVENGKPAPDIFLKAASMLGANPRDCIVFEDSVNGIKSAVSAGMKCIAIPDVMPFDKQTESVLFAKLDDFLQAIDLLKLN